MEMSSYCLKDNFPLHTAYLYLTWRCNLQCKHCWVSAGDAGEHYECNDETFYSFVQQTADMNVKNIRFTGGEPLMRWDRIQNTVDSCKSRGISFEIETNAVSLTNVQARFFKDNDFHVSVSLHGSQASTHDLLTNVPGSFDKAVENIKYLVNELKLYPLVITCVDARNYKSLESRIRFFHSIGVRDIKINPIILSGRAATDTGLFIGLTLEMHREVNIMVNRLCDELNCRIIFEEPMCLLSVSQLTKCSSVCGITRLISLLPDGTLSLCGGGRYDDRLCVEKWDSGKCMATIWEKNEFLSLVRNEALGGVCKNCVHLEQCQGSCRIQSLQYFGRWGMPMPMCHELYEAGRFPSTRLRPIKYQTFA